MSDMDSASRDLAWDRMYAERIDRFIADVNVADSNEAWRLEADYYARAMHQARRELNALRIQLEQVRLAAICLAIVLGAAFGILQRPYEWAGWCVLAAGGMFLAVINYRERRYRR